MSDIPTFPYRLLWGERSLRSVANLTRLDAGTFFGAAATAGVHIYIQHYTLGNADRALDDLRRGRVHGAAVLVPPEVC